MQKIPAVAGLTLAIVLGASSVLAEQTFRPDGMQLCQNASSQRTTDHCSAPEPTERTGEPIRGIDIILEDGVPNILRSPSGQTEPSPQRGAEPIRPGEVRPQPPIQRPVMREHPGGVRGVWKPGTTNCTANTCIEERQQITPP